MKKILLLGLIALILFSASAVTIHFYWISLLQEERGDVQKTIENLQETMNQLQAQIDRVPYLTSIEQYTMKLSTLNEELNTAHTLELLSISGLVIGTLVLLYGITRSREQNKRQT